MGFFDFFKKNKEEKEAQISGSGGLPTPTQAAKDITSSTQTSSNNVPAPTESSGNAASAGPVRKTANT